MEEISIRQATEKDHDEIVSMWWNFQKEGGDEFGYFIKLNEQNRRRFAGWSKERIAAGELLVPECGGKVAGYLIFEEVHFPLELVRKAANITDVYVKPEFRRNGAAEKMVEECFARLKSRGFEIVRLMVTAGNEKAERLYEKAGFKVMNKQLEKKL
ncbi:MAG: N-acetyltransferase [Candidatus Thermoplasmatota archaeon]|nr:N-acetyltransferase [Candidatus Thermoplasmatota archaeon]